MKYNPESQRLIKSIIDGWSKHHQRLLDEGLIEKISEGQNPWMVAVSCSDSRIDVADLFGLKPQGDVFQVKNVCGLLSEDAIAALVYALRHLKPKVLVLLHHICCGGYHSLFIEGVEPEIRDYLRHEHAVEAKKQVIDYLGEKGLELDSSLIEQLTIEEGARMQARELMGFLNQEYKEICDRIQSGSILLLTLVHDLKTDEVYVVPERLEGSETAERERIQDLLLK